MEHTISTYKRSVQCVLFLFCISIIGTTAQAQFKAGIQGTITDSAGAVLPEVKIILTNKETGQIRNSQTGNDGFYRISGLPPSTYKMLLEKQGMKKVELDYIIVDAETVKGLDASMEAGAITDVVNISAQTLPSLQTENANLEGTISERELKMLPQVGRDPYELARTAPGVFGQGARSDGGGAVNLPNSSGPGGSASSIFQTENQVPITTGGQRITANNYQIDGVNVNSLGWGGAAVVTPSQEAVKELKVSASGYSAENGRGSGVQVEVITKNGTNDFHGSTFFKYNEPALNAYNKWGGPNDGDRPKRIEQRLRQYGGSLGGPILKNKLFFFATYETLGAKQNNFQETWIETTQYAETLKRLRPNGLATKIVNYPNIRPNVLAVLPGTCASASGDFNKVNDQGILITNCKEVAGGLDLGSPTPRIDAVDNPRIGGGFDGIPDVQRVFIDAPSIQKSHSISTRIDFQLTGKDLITFSNYYVPQNTKFFADNRLAQEFHSKKRNHATAAIWNRTISSTMINEARFNISGWNFDEIGSNPDMPWGIPASYLRWSPSGEFSIGPGGPGVFYQRAYNFRDVLSKVVNSHAIKFGGEYVREHNDVSSIWAARPIYAFGDLWDFADGVAAEEKSNFDPKTGKRTDGKKRIKSSIIGLFAQDDWKVRPNLTLNIGLRWEYFSPISADNNQMTNLILGSGARTLLDAKIKTGGQLYNGDKNNFAPQFGFAWNPKLLSNKLVLRGGFGLGYNRLPQSRTLDGSLNPPFFSYSEIKDKTKTVFALGSDINDFYSFPGNPNAILTIDPNTNIPTEGLPVNLSGTFQNVPTPYSFRYSLDAQYELPGNMTATLGYQGSSGRKFMRQMLYSLFYAKTSQMGTVSMIHTDVNSNFNALLAGLSRRFTNGLQFNAQYRWSKSMDHCSSDDNCVQTYQIDQNEEWGLSDYDVKHSFTLSGTWDLPLRRDMKGISGNILGGWQISPIMTINSGFPWTATYRFPDQDCWSAQSKILNCPRPAGFIGGSQDTSNDAFISKDGSLGAGASSLFLIPIRVTDPLTTPIPRPGIGRNTFRGPSYFSVDMSLTKRVNIPKFLIFGEGTGFDLRANFFNIFNNLNLSSIGHGSDQTRVNNVHFGRATGALGGRMVELQARFSF